MHRVIDSCRADYQPVICRISRWAAKGGIHMLLLPTSGALAQRTLRDRAHPARPVPQRFLKPARADATDIVNVSQRHARRCSVGEVT